MTGETLVKVEAAVAHGPGQPFTLETLELEAPREDEVLVRIAAVGICHGDIAFRDLSPTTEFPIVLGHEGAGTVERVGAAVTRVSAGDRVAISFDACGVCDRCQVSDVAHCLQFGVLNFAARRRDGTKALHGQGAPVSSHFFGQSSFATHALASERNVVRLPDDVPFTLAAPLGCSVQTGAGAVLRTLDARAGESLLVIGCGAVGLSAIMAASVRGCAPVIAIEPNAARRELASELGATHVIDPGEDDVAAAVRSITLTGVRHAFDTSGRADMLEAAVALLAPHGTLGVAAAANGGQRLPGSLFELIALGRAIKGVNEGDSDPAQAIPELIALYRDGKLPLERLITCFPFAQINEAIDAQHRGECIKAVLTMSEAHAG